MEILGFSLFFMFYLMFISAILAVDPLSEALLSLKSEITDDSGSLKDWFSPSGENPSGKITACSWSGVTCDGNSTMIVGLDLSMKKLGGSISGKQFNRFVDLVSLNLSYNSFSEKLPVGIFDLTNLTTLDISRNNFSGRFPKGVSKLRRLVVLDAFSNSFSGPLPAEVSQVQTLRVLNFAGSYFSGPIPSEYGSFKSLEFIHLAGNLLGGEIPPELGRLSTVTHMEIGYNMYRGTIPWQLGNMTELQYLDIADANLSGAVPAELGNLTKLDSLFLFRNQLSGPVPPELSNIVSLKSLDLSDNLLSGPIPPSFSNLKNLSLLSLMYNDLTGTVPEAIAELPQLETLLIWNNFLSGSLPESLGRHSNIKYVDVSTNNFVGLIPPDICSKGSLLKLILFSNNFTGGLSPSLSNCSSLVRLRLEDNLFSGKISLKFSDLNDISYIDLSRNGFSGGIPNDISKASNLQYLNLSYNHEIRGKIPPELWSMPLLQNFSVSSSMISGIIPPFKHCKSLSVIELSMNNLSGFFPENITNCESIEKIDLAFNNLTGHIPEELANLQALSVLDLSHNNFTGQIPLKFANSSSLMLLNVSFNDISGSIPRSKLFKTMNFDSFIGNPKLCGAPLRSCVRENVISSGFEYGSKRTQKLAWVLIICALVVLFITILGFGVYYFRRWGGNRLKLVNFSGIPLFSANDVLKSLNSEVCKAVLPNGITVSVKKIDLGIVEFNYFLTYINRMGSFRHKNLVELLGFCYNKNLAYLLYEYLPNGNLGEKMKVKRDWGEKCKIVIGIARGLCFLHRDCAIYHGNLKAGNIIFDENMEPRLAEFGLKSLVRLSYGAFSPSISGMEKGEIEMAEKTEEIYKDISDFGEIVLEILTNGRLRNAGGGNIQSKSKDALLREIYTENDASSSHSLQDEIDLLFEVSLLCTRSNPSERPSIEEAMKLLSKLNPPRK